MYVVLHLDKGNLTPLYYIYIEDKKIVLINRLFLYPFCSMHMSTKHDTGPIKTICIMYLIQIILAHFRSAPLNFSK